MHTWRTPVLPAILLNLIAVLCGSAAIASAKETLVTGTAFAVTSSGILVTNAHVVEGCTSVLTLHHGDRTVGEVVARDTGTDLALISIKKSTTPLKLRSLPALKLGESAIVYGFPLFGTLSTGGNLTIGNVSGLLGIEDDPTNIQISAPLQPGNSGGAVLDESGLVIAVVVARYRDVSSQNVNFAISLETLKNFLNINGISFETDFSLTNLSTTQIGDIGQNASHLVACQKAAKDDQWGQADPIVGNGQIAPETTVRAPRPQTQPTPHVVQLPLAYNELKVSEIRRPYALIAPDRWDITVSNIGSHVLIEATLGYSRTRQRYCSPDLRSYDGLKKLKFRIEPGDSIKLSEDLISDAEWFCFLKVYGLSNASDEKAGPPADAFEVAIASYSEASKRWLRRHRDDLMSSYERVNLVERAATFAVEQRHLIPDTPAYFDAINEIMGYKEERSHVDKLPPPPPPRNGVDPFDALPDEPR